MSLGGGGDGVIDWIADILFKPGRNLSNSKRVIFLPFYPLFFLTLSGQRSDFKDIV